MTTLSYTVEVTDIEEFIDHELRTTYRARIWTQSACSAAVVGVLTYAFVQWQSQQNVASIGIAVVVGLVSFFAMPSVTRDQARKAIVKRYSKTRDTALGPQTMSLGPEGLDIANPNGRSHLIWSAVQRVALTKDYAFVFTGPFKAFILPLHHLSPSVRTEVLATLAKYVPTLAPTRASAA